MAKSRQESQEAVAAAREEELRKNEEKTRHNAVLVIQSLDESKARFASLFAGVEFKIQSRYLPKFLLDIPQFDQLGTLFVHATIKVSPTKYPDNLTYVSLAFDHSLTVEMIRQKINGWGESSDIKRGEIIEAQVKFFRRDLIGELRAFERLQNRLYQEERPMSFFEFPFPYPPPYR